VHLVGQIPYCQHCHSVISLNYIQCMHINNLNAFPQESQEPNFIEEFDINPILCYFHEIMFCLLNERLFS